MAKASWKEFGSPRLDFCGALFFAGLFARLFARLRQASFSPAKSPAKGSEETSMVWDSPHKLSGYICVCVHTHTHTHTRVI